MAAKQREQSFTVLIPADEARGLPEGRARVTLSFMGNASPQIESAYVGVAGHKGRLRSIDLDDGHVVLDVDETTGELVGMEITDIHHCPELIEYLKRLRGRQQGLLRAMMLTMHQMCIQVVTLVASMDTKQRSAPGIKSKVKRVLQKTAGDLWADRGAVAGMLVSAG